MHLFKIIFIPLFILFFLNFSFATTLEEIKERDFLICGVSEPTTGFADFDDESNWKGLQSLWWSKSYCIHLQKNLVGLATVGLSPSPLYDGAFRLYLQTNS